MKRSFALLAAVLLAVFLPLSGLTAFAACGGRGHGCGNNRGCRPNGVCAYVDKNGDGVCDTCRRQNAAHCPFVDENGDGICDHRGTGGRCAFVDKNGDGLCDACKLASADHCSFVDKDGDGFCDCRGAGNCPGGSSGANRGKVRGHGCGRHC